MGTMGKLTRWLRGQPSGGQREHYSLFSAAEAGDDKAVKKLLSEGKDVDKGEWDGRKPLHAAAAGRHTGCVRLLLDKGADINANSWMGTALHCAIQNDDVELVILLLERGANPNIVSHTTGKKFAGSPPLVVAAGKGHRPMVELLLAQGADPTIPSGTGAILPVDAAKDDAIKALLQRAMGPAREKQKEKEEEKEDSLDTVIPKVQAVLRDLPVSDEERLRGQIKWIAERWQVGSSRIVEGDARKIEATLLECFKSDLRGEDFYFNMDTDTDGWTGVAHNAFFRCGRGMHHVGRYGEQQYIAVLHRRF